MNKTPAPALQRIRFCALAGVQEARLSDKKVSGRWKSLPDRIYGPTQRRLAQDFANWSSEPKEILRFTKKFGPLRGRWKGGRRFEFSFQAWRSELLQFRGIWEGMSLQTRRYGGIAILDRTAHGWDFFDGKLTYTAASLGEFLQLDLFSCPVERLRRCLKPDCHSPYFIARHLKQKYCSDECSKWAQSIWKKGWWRQRGKKWRSERRMRQQKRR